jgi:hypothetical protein
MGTAASLVAFNWFCGIDLGAGLLAGVACAVFVVRAWPRSRRGPHLLFSLELGLLSVFLLLWAVAANVVPAGESAAATPGASARTLVLFRALYTLATLFTAALLHFAFELTGRFQLTAGRLVSFYGVFFVACGLYWHGELLTARVAPLAATSSWKVAVPWMPDVTAAALVLTGVWIVVIGAIQFLIWTTPGHRMDTTTVGLVVTGLAGAAMGLDGVVNYSGVAIGSAVMLFGMALTGRGLLRDGGV